MNKRRLLKLADLLDADAKNKNGIKFDLGGWGSSEHGPVAVSCGTTACAMGLAVISGAFKKAGLSNYFSENSRSIAPVFRSTGGKHHDGFEAAEALFQISSDTATWLFGRHSYSNSLGHGARGERAVAKRIRDLVAGKARP
jgi:hypothetical protein